MKCIDKKSKKNMANNASGSAFNGGLDGIYYYQEKSLVHEVNPEFDRLAFLYKTVVGKLLRRFLCLKFFSKMVGRYFDSLSSAHGIDAFIKKYAIDMADYEKAEYRSFNDFFIRKLRVGARSIDKTLNALVSPCDGKLFILPVLDEKSLFYCKALPFNLEEFIGDKKKAQHFVGGSLMIFRLAPYDYHRFHFPIDCIPADVKKIKGKLESVNPFVYKQGVQVLTKNERHLIELQAEYFSSLLMIAVGALCVGKIVTVYRPHQPVHKGDEAGYFMFGGSTIGLIAPPKGIIFEHEFIENSRQGFETAVKMGQRIGLLQPLVSFQRKEPV